MNGVSFIRREGILHRVSEPDSGEGDVVAREQLVLPVQCRRMVIELAHSIPTAGHLGKHKNADRVLLYWPTFRKDVAGYCKQCEICQKTTPVKPSRAPLIPLSIVDEPFQKVAMDIVGPLPRSSSGNKYVLVISDYATRYPEVVPMKAIDAESVAEELVKIFAKVGLPEKKQGRISQANCLQKYIGCYMSTLLGRAHTILRLMGSLKDSTGL